MSANLVHLRARAVFDKADARAREKEALRDACAVTGITLERVAIVLGEAHHTVRAWASPARADLSLPAWAWRRLQVVLPELASAMSAQLDPAPESADLDDATVLQVTRALGDLVSALASPARHTPDGAHAALGTIARADGLLSRVAPALRARTEARRAA